MVILTMAKFLGNLRKDSILSLFDTTNIFFCLGSLFASKMPLVNFFWDTCYMNMNHPQQSSFHHFQHSRLQRGVYISNNLLSPATQRLTLTFFISCAWDLRPLSNRSPGRKRSLWKEDYAKPDGRSRKLAT